jgi:hypothetical protein
MEAVRMGRWDCGTGGGLQLTTELSMEETAEIRVEEIEGGNITTRGIQNGLMALWHRRWSWDDHAATNGEDGGG